MFTSRSGSQGHPQAAPPQSIEAVRRRARHRLIGAAVLVLLGVVGFPLLFDTQPRPIPVDIPIVIPAKNATGPLAAPKTTQADNKAASIEARPADAAKAPVESVTTSESLSAREEVVEPVQTMATASQQPKKEPIAAPKTEAKTEPKPATKPDAKVAKPDDAEAQRARALLENGGVGSPSEQSAAGDQRIVIQVGAFADVLEARQARMKLERAGLKTYTHVAETPSGRLIRVRTGPYTSKAEADKVAAKIKTLGLPARMLTL